MKYPVTNCSVKWLGMLLCCMFVLTGCLHPVTHSMGATLMPAPLQHRVNSDSVGNNVDVSVTGFWGHTEDADNVKSLNAGGGNLSATYRFGKSESHFFANGAVGGFGGKTKFACSKDETGCDETYDKRESAKYFQWLESDEGGKSYGFAHVQERIVLGMDFNFSKIILGFAEGLLFSQGSGSYEDKRERLIDDRVVENTHVEHSSSWGNVTMFWLGAYFGDHGRYGNFVVEYDLLRGEGGFPDGLTYSMKYTYTHPTGIYVGAAEGSLMSLMLYGGKTFSF